MALGLATGTLLLGGCDKKEPTTQITNIDTVPVNAAIGAPEEITALGEIELLPSTPKHVDVAGRDWIFTATPLADGNVALAMESEGMEKGPMGGPTREINTMKVPPNVKISGYLGKKEVSYSIKMKAATTPDNVPLDVATGLPVQMTQLGEIELSASTPKTIMVDGSECIFTATPLPDGNLALVIDSFADKAPNGRRTRQRFTTIVPPNVDYKGYIGPKLVSLNIRMKES